MVKLLCVILVRLSKSIKGDFSTLLGFLRDFFLLLLTETDFIDSLSPDSISYVMIGLGTFFSFGKTILNEKLLMVNYLLLTVLKVILRTSLGLIC
jgi:hypothetical protein